VALPARDPRLAADLGDDEGARADRHAALDAVGRGIDDRDLVRRHDRHPDLAGDDGGIAEVGRAASIRATTRFVRASIRASVPTVDEIQTAAGEAAVHVALSTPIRARILPVRGSIRTTGPPGPATQIEPNAQTTPLAPLPVGMRFTTRFVRGSIRSTSRLPELVAQGEPAQKVVS